MPSEIVLRHHAEQKLIARNAIAELELLWGILDFHALRETTGDWLRAVRPVIERGYLTSQYVAAEFVKNSRRAALPSAPLLDLSVPNPYGTFGQHAPPDRETQLRIMVAMKVTGPGWLMENSPPGTTEEQIPDLLRRGFSKSSGAATRIVLNGGRGMVVVAANVDPHALGVASVVDEDSTCTSCTELASMRFMKTDGLRRMRAVAVGHDFCRCSAQVLYS